MLLAELAKAIKEKTAGEAGTFVGLRFDNESCSALVKFIEDNKIPNAIPTNEIHVTLIYSKKSIAKTFEAEGTLEEPIEVKGKAFDIFKSKDDNNCLVLKLDSKALTARHKYIREEHGATHGFDEYLPHTTLTYDAGDFDISKLKIPKELKKLKLVTEYSEVLD